MLRATLSKAMWVGRGAAAVFGLALVLALIMGVGTMALAAVPGDPFRLGQTNGIDQMSTLVGTVATPMLKVDNGSTATGATALDLRVEPGKAPMKVNSGTKVASLNADKVDGKDSTAFYAAGSKVADSSHADTADTATSADSATSAEDANTLDGKDSTEFLGATQKAADSDQLDGIDSSGFAAFKRTVVVGPVGTDAQNGQALLDAISNITDASASKPYLVHIEPATYDLGNGSLNMKQWVDIEGSGELNTVITSGVGTFNCSLGTVNGANNAEMRFLTVRNTGTGANSCKIAISNVAASPRLTHLTAEAIGVGGDNNIGVNTSNSSTTMTDVTATGSGQTGSANYGVFGSQSNLTIKQSKLTGSGGAFVNHALRIESGTTAKVALSQLVGGGVDSNQSTVQCFNNYNENMAAVSCP
jgi:hypothetical protein